MEDARISHSRASVQVALPLSLIWIVVGTYIGSWQLAAAAALVGLGFTSGLVLHGIQKHTAARITWFILANFGAFWGTFLVHPLGNVHFMFAPACAMPFLMFSLGRDRRIVTLLVGLPIILWFVGWYSGYGDGAYFVITQDTAISTIAPMSALTVFVLVMIQMSYFASVFSSYSRGLAVARRRALSSSEAKSAFLKSMSHELRTPLNAISGFSDLTLEDAKAGRKLDAQKVQERMEIVKDASNKIVEMVDNMLAYASISSTPVEKDLVPVDTAAVIEKELSKVTAKAQQKSLNISSDTDRAEWVMADAAKLSAVVQQLLSNGIKFAPEGGWVHITVKKPGHGRLRMQFSDSGGGFSKDAATTAFQPFQRLDAANGVTPGVGVGLAIVRAHVQAMKGRVGIDADSYGKNVVWVEIPLA